jgi:2-amino-4-hydroxy-6-hydroxymethyldihydropteridine diphosphokinase / dihydropteroate synthase
MIFLITWAQQMIEKLLSCGFSLSSIIIDPGIGFWKTAFQTIMLLRAITQLKALGVSILVGHSRKSYMQAFSNITCADQCDIETIGVSLALQDKIDYLRVHNVHDHMRALVAHHVTLS